MRADGRQPDDLRPITFERDFTEQAAGSVLVSFGATRVLCTASIDEQVPRWMKGKGKGWVTAEYSMLPGASAERIGREAAKGKQSGRTQEIQRLIGRSLRAVTDLSALGEREARRRICVISQEVHVFAGTLLDDVRLARAAATEQALARRRAEARQDVEFGLLAEHYI